MNRLQKKCLMASAGLHLLLLLILFVGPAFLPSSSRLDLPTLNFIPVKTVDALMSGGGNPNGRPPAPAPAPLPPPPPPVARPAVDKTPPAEPRKEPEIKQPGPEAESFEVSTKPKRKPQISTSAVKRASVASTNDSRARDQARENAEARRAAAVAISQAVAGIQNGLSGDTTIELKGPGGGGAPYANWMQAVKSVYERAWVLPDGITDNSATTEVSVTIARDGRVLSSSIVRSSGNSAVDHSVQLTLDRVRYAAPLPDDAKEDQRTVSINFNVKAKLLG
jgi:TonB family protein